MAPCCETGEAGLQEEGLCPQLFPSRQLLGQAVNSMLYACTCSLTQVFDGAWLLLPPCQDVAFSSCCVLFWQTCSGLVLQELPLTPCAAALFLSGNCFKGSMLSTSALK